jgi:hypothetical protein
VAFSPGPGRPDEPADADRTDLEDTDPDGPYQWSETEWLPDSWEPAEPIQPTRDVDRFRKTTAGAMIAAGMIGLEKVLMPEREERVPITWESPGEPPGPRHLEFDLDPDDPSASTVTVRPWMVDPDPPHQG